MWTKLEKAREDDGCVNPSTWERSPCPGISGDAGGLSPTVEFGDGWVLPQIPAVCFSEGEELSSWGLSSSWQVADPKNPPVEIAASLWEAWQGHSRAVVFVASQEG